MIRRTRRKLFAINVRTQFENIGDALINRELVRLLAGRGDVLVGMAAAPHSFRSALMEAAPANVRATPSRVIFWTRIVSFLLFSSRGGGEFYLALNPGGYTGEQTRIAAAKATIKRAALRLLEKVGAKVVLIGVSYESLGARHLRSISKLASSIDLHLVRDSGSMEYCLARGLKVSGQMPDLAFNLPRLPRSQVVSSRPSIAISLRRMGPKLDSFVQQLYAWAEVEEFAVEFCSQVRRDDAYQEQIGRGFSVAVGCRALATVDDALEFYSRQALVFSNRLHVLLLAWRAGAIPVATLLPGKNEKIRRLFHDLEMGSHIIELSEFDCLVGGPDFMQNMLARDRLNEIFVVQQKLLRHCIDTSVGHVL